MSESLRICLGSDNETLGTRLHHPPARPVVSVCGWCPDHAEQTASARANGYDVTHGLCAVCEAQLNGEMDMETP